MFRDFPGGPVVKNQPYNAGNVGSIPGQGTKIPHAVGQLSPHTTTPKLACLNDRAHMLQITEPMHSGAPEPQLERENLHVTTREKPARHSKDPVPQRKILHASTKTPCATIKTQRSQKKKINK